MKQNKTKGIKYRHGLGKKEIHFSSVGALRSIHEDYQLQCKNHAALSFSIIPPNALLPLPFSFQVVGDTLKNILLVIYKPEQSLLKDVQHTSYTSSKSCSTSELYGMRDKITSLLLRTNNRTGTVGGNQKQPPGLFCDARALGI